MLRFNTKNFLLKVINYSLLVVIVLMPIYFAFFQENYTVFDLNKASLLRLGVLVLIASWLIYFALTSQIIIFKDKAILWFWLFLVLVIIISTIFSPQISISLLGSYERQQGLNTILAYLLFFIFLISFFINQSGIKKVIIALNFSAVLACLYGLMQAVGLDFLYWSESSALRIFSGFGQPNFFGHYLVVMIPLTTYSIWFISRKLIIRFLYALLLIAELICLLFSYSRGAWVAFIITSFVLVLFFLWHNQKKTLAVIILSLALFSGVLLFSSGIRNSIIAQIDYNKYGLINRMISTFDFSDAGSVSSRLKYWQAAYKVFSETSWTRRIIGFGPDMETNVFVGVYQPNWGYSERLNAFPDRAHNNLIDVVLQFGIAGLSAMLSLVFFCIKKLFNFINRKFNEDSWLALALLTALLAYTVNNFFSFSLTAMSLIFFIILGLAWRLGSPAEKIESVNISLFNPISRWLITAAFIFFIGLIFYSHSIKPLLADYYYIQVKKSEVNKDCWQILNNMESVMEWYPVSHYYSRIYLDYNINCLASASSDASRKTIINNIIDQVKIVESGDLQFYSLINLSHAYSVLGYYVDIKYYDLAEKYYQQMLKWGPNITTTYQDYGRLKLWQARYAEAREIFWRGLAVTPSLDGALPNGNKGFIGAIAQQIAHFHYLIGLTYKYENNFTQAEIEFKQALKVDPTLMSAYKDLVDMSYGNKDFLQAIDYNKAAFKLDNQNSLWPYNLAQLYFELGDKALALDYAKQAQVLEQGSQAVEDLLKKIE